MHSNYKQIKPRTHKLKSLIKLYYIQQSKYKNTIEKITYFPNYTTTLNIYKNSKVRCSKYSRTHEKVTNDSYLKLLVGKIDRSREVIQIGEYNKLSIVFHPLGLNNFISAPLSTLVKDHFSFFDSFE